MKAKITKENGLLLKNVTVRCPGCGKEKKNNAVFLPVDNNHAVKLCFECMVTSGYSACKECHKFYKTVCGCQKRLQNGVPGLLHYAYMPKWKIHAKAGETTFGVELELAATNGEYKQDAFIQNIGKVLDGFAVIKHDGSIKGAGVEIVLPPMSVNGMIENHDIITEMFKKIGEMGWIGISENTCAGHVHYCNPLMSNNQLIKTEEWFITNSKMINVLSRRTRYQRQYAAIPTDTRAPEQWSSRRNRWLNYSNICTVEHRYLGGISTLNHLLYNIQTAEAVTEFGATNPDRKDASLFKKYVEKNSDQWPELWRYLSRVRNNL